MENQQKSSKAIHITLWIAQVVLAALLVMGAVMKFMPIEKIAPMMPWMAQVSPMSVRLLGLVDLLGAIGIIIPSLLRIKPQLTPWAALCIIVLMLSASIFHVSRGEASAIGFNIFCALIATFIAWGRFKKVPILPKSQVK